MPSRFFLIYSDSLLQYLSEPPTTLWQQFQLLRVIAEHHWLLMDRVTEHGNLVSSLPPSSPPLGLTACADRPTFDSVYGTDSDPLLMAGSVCTHLISFINLHFSNFFQFWLICQQFHFNNKDHF